MDWFYEIKEGFIVPRTGFEPVTYGLEICWFLEEKIRKILLIDYYSSLNFLNAFS